MINSPLNEHELSKIDKFIKDNRNIFYKPYNGINDFKNKYPEFNKLFGNLTDKDQQRVWLSIYSKVTQFKSSNFGKSINTVDTDIKASSILFGNKKDKTYLGVFIMVIILFIAFITYVLIQHKKSNERKEIMKIETVNRKGKFISIHECLAYVEMDIPLEKIYIDNTPTLVWGGFKGSDGSFRCEIVATGTQGVYVQGSYNVPITALRQNMKK